MAEFRMPSLGADMEAGTLVEWLKQPGESVRHGDVIAVVETQKGAIEVEVFESGVIEKLLVPVGHTVPVGTALAFIRVAGAADAAAVPQSAIAPPSGPVPVPSAPPSPQVVTVDRAAHRTSPAARRFAQEKGIDLATIEGSGPDGAIVFIDVENAWKRVQALPSEVAQPTQAPIAAKPSRKGIDLEAMRLSIAAAMARSKREIPHYYVQHTADLGAAMAWLARTNAQRPPEKRLLLGALLVKAVALSVRALPKFNGFFRNGHFEPADRVHVGNAIALRGGGLVAPAIHDADRLGLDEIMAKLRDLVNRVRAGRYRSSELSDPTVTLTSLGDRGADALLPIVNPPQVAIIGAGTPVRRPWLVGEDIVARPLLQLALAADHRVSDGHDGSLLLADIARRLVEPEKL